MKRYLLDTGIMGDFINHRNGVDDRVRAARKSGAKIGTCMPVIGELLYGAEYSATRDANLKRIHRALTGIVCWPFDRLAAEEYGRLAAALKRAGRSVGQVDIQVAAIALGLNDCTVVSSDGDFLAISGLSVEDWST